MSRNQKRNTILNYLLNFFQTIMFGLSMIYNYSKLKNKDNELSYTITICLFLMISCSYIIWAIARLQLGRLWYFYIRNCILYFRSLTIYSKPMAKSILITNGIYKYFKHPIYIFGTITICLYIILLNRIKWLLLLLIIFPLQYLRMKREEIQLEDRYGDEYVEYCQTLIL